MENTYWHKQTAGQPLFPDLIWSRPQNKQSAGKLLIVGGNVHGFSAVGQAYSAAVKAGVGTVRVVLPDSLQKTVSKMMPEAEFAPSNKSGGFGVAALALVLVQSEWADGVLLAGGFGRNSETAILIEKFLTKYKGLVTLVNDTCEYVTTSHDQVKQRGNTTVVMTLAQLQRLLTAYRWPRSVTLDMPLLQLIEIMHDFTAENPINIVTKQLENLLVSSGGQVSTSKSDKNLETWRTEAAAKAVVWWLQNPTMPFEAITTSFCTKAV